MRKVGLKEVMQLAQGPAIKLWAFVLLDHFHALQVLRLWCVDGLSQTSHLGVDGVPYLVYFIFNICLSFSAILCHFLWRSLDLCKYLPIPVSGLGSLRNQNRSLKFSGSSESKLGLIWKFSLKTDGKAKPEHTRFPMYFTMNYLVPAFSIKFYKHLYSSKREKNVEFMTESKHLFLNFLKIQYESLDIGESVHRNCLSEKNKSTVSRQ